MLVMAHKIGFPLLWYAFGIVSTSAYMVLTHTSTPFILIKVKVQAAEAENAHTHTQTLPLSAVVKQETAYHCCLCC